LSVISIYSRSGDSGAITGGVLTGKVQSVTALSPQSLRSHEPFTVSRETRAKLVFNPFFVGNTFCFIIEIVLFSDM